MTSQNCTQTQNTPVPPLPGAVNQVLSHFLHALHVAVATAVEQRQPRLDECAGSLVQGRLGTGCVAAVKLRLRQDQVNQADELLWFQAQDKLLCPLLRTHQDERE